MASDPASVIRESEAALEELQRQFASQEHNLHTLITQGNTDRDKRIQEAAAAERDFKQHRDWLDQEEITPLKAYASLVLSILCFLGASQLMSWTLTSIQLPSGVATVSQIILRGGLAIQTGIRSLSLQAIAPYVGLALFLLALVLPTEFLQRVRLKRHVALVVGGLGLILAIIPFYDFSGASSGVGLWEGALASSAIASPLVLMLGTERLRELVNRFLRSRYSLWVIFAILIVIVAGIIFRQNTVVLALSLPLSLFFFAVGLSGVSGLAALRKYARLQQEHEEAQRAIDRLQLTISQYESRLDGLPERRRTAIQNEYDRRSNRLSEHDVSQRWKTYVNGGRPHE
jgi:hypothetical protein